MTANATRLRRVADLHCDLLYYLAFEDTRSPLDDRSRASLGQLEAGGVDLQVFAIFTLGGDDALARGMAQVNAYERMLSQFPDRIRGASKASLATDIPGNPVSALCAIENAEAFCGREETVSQGLARLDALTVRVGPVSYVSLTWAMANRFGGGNASGKGITADGQHLVAGLAERAIPVDLSHTSDKLAEDILTFLDAEALTIPVVASHSNFRAVRARRRNLPDELAQEIGRRGGVIGLNLVRTFVGPRVETLVDHVNHATQLGLLEHLVLGTDFFYELDLPNADPERPYRFFFPEYDSAECHERLTGLLAAETNLTPTQLDDIASGNLRRFLGRA